MRRRIVRAVVCFLLAVRVGFRIAEAANDGRNVVIGQLWLSNPVVAGPFDRAFRAGLEELGYSDGKNVQIIARYAEGEAPRFAALAQELLATFVDALLVSPAAMKSALEATKSIPIVCASIGNPVEEGLVKSLAHPGGNLTGLAVERAATDPKRLQIATEIIPGLKRLGLLFESYPNQAEDLERFSALARNVGVSVKTYEVRNLTEIHEALRTIEVDRPQALLGRGSALFTLHRNIIFGATATKLPVISEDREYAEAGALVTYGPDAYDLYRRAATYVDKILKGAKPSDLPIQQPTKFVLLVNLKTARSLGVTVPQSILLLADEVIR